MNRVDRICFELLRGAAGILTEHDRVHVAAERRREFFRFGRDLERDAPRLPVRVFDENDDVLHLDELSFTQEIEYFRSARHGIGRFEHFAFAANGRRCKM